MDAVVKRWDATGETRVPYWVYTDPDIYQTELERIWYGPTWLYAGLEVEIPEVGDYRTTTLGERSVIVIRSAKDQISVVENRCRHRGVEICQVRAGKAKDFTCPYHRWSYALDGALQGIPFKRGLKGRGGMPADFKPEDHGLVRLKVEVVNGVIWASFSDKTPPFREYLGETLWKPYNRIVSGRRLRVVGYNRQTISANWKMVLENIRDPYHGTLLHVFLPTFGLIDPDFNNGTVTDKTGAHSAMVPMPPRAVTAKVDKNEYNFDGALQLADRRLIEAVHELEGEETTGQVCLCPNVIILQQINAMQIRQVIPKGPGKFELIWTHLGFEDDDEEMRKRRVRHANLFGAAGYVAVDDSEAFVMAHRGYVMAAENSEAVLEMGRDVKDQDLFATESALRDFYRYYREVMSL